MLKRTSKQLSLFSSLEDMLNHQHPLFQLSHKINWQRFDDAFSPLYCSTNGRPAHPIRLMCSLLILKHLRNVSDEMVVSQWSENAYYQYFCGGLEFTPKEPCDASELVHFRNRIGEKGMEIILAESSGYEKMFELYYRDLSQNSKSRNKVYSLHEPEVVCISKGKEHKKYEFGNKVSILRSWSGLILGACSFRNEYDGHTIQKTPEQTRRMTGRHVNNLAVDRGYRGGNRWGIQGYSSRILLKQKPPTIKRKKNTSCFVNGQA